MNEWNRKIDKIFACDGRVKIYCYDGDVYIGRCIGDCESLDKNGDDVAEYVSKLK